MHGRKLMHTKQSQVHLRGAGEGASILCCTTGGRWDTTASSAGEFGPISTVEKQDMQNCVRTEQSQLQLRAAGGGAPISPCR